MRMRKRLLSLYPEAWRDRYAEEMSALLDETPPRITTTLDLLRGALTAHLRPLASSAPTARARGTIIHVLGCFIVFCVFGSGFAKTTENYDYTEHVHPLLGISHSVILIAAVVAAGALALAAAPLGLASLALARRTREPALMKLIAVPPAAIATFAGSVELLVLWLNAHHHRAGLGGWLLLGLCVLCAATGGFACWAAPRALMRRIDVPPSAFAFSVVAVGLVALCMVAIAVATGVFLVGIAADASHVGASGNAPLQLINVTTSIAIQFTAMLGLSAVAAVSAARGFRAARAL
jgi:hypothetical protein